MCNILMLLQDSLGRSDLVRKFKHRQSIPPLEIRSPITDTGKAVSLSAYFLTFNCFLREVGLSLPTGVGDFGGGEHLGVHPIVDVVEALRGGGAATVVAGLDFRIGRVLGMGDGVVEQIAP